jgi:hypothetical protein
MTKKVSRRGEGFAFFRWHSLRYPEWAHCVGHDNDRNLCVAYWKGNVR